MYFKYVFKELFRRKSKTATVVLTVAAITSILLLFSGVLQSFYSSIYQPFRDIGTDMILQKSDNTTAYTGSKLRMPFGKGLFTEDEAEALSEIKHVDGMSKSLVLWYFGKNGFITVEGIEPGSFTGSKLATQIKRGRFLSVSDHRKAVVESHFANFNHIKVGDNISIGGNSFEVVGILNVRDKAQIFSSNVYITLRDAQKISGIKGCNQIYLKIDELSSEKPVRKEIERLNSRIVIISGNSLAASLSNVADIYTRYYYMGSGAMVLIAALILLKVNTVNLMERKRDIAVMRAVGWTKRDISKQIISELFLQTIIGFLLGLCYLQNISLVRY